MSRVLLALYNGLYDSTDCEKLPCWYDSIVKGLRKRGHSVFLWQIKEFAPPKTNFGETDKDFLKEYAPDICLSFNNVLPNIDGIVDCPVVTILVDSVKYLSNNDLLNNRIIGCFQYANYAYLIDKYGCAKDHVHILTPFTEIRPNSNIMPNTNISFIGTRFGVPKHAEIGYFSIDKGTRDEYCACLEYIKKNPLVDEEDVFSACSVQSEYVRSNLVVSDVLSMLSAEKRVRTLSAIVDLGLELYGTRSWLERYHFDSRLNAAFVDREVYSLEHNQEIYNRSKIGLNVSHVQAVDGFPWRVLDILSSNSCFVTDWHDKFKTCFDGLYFPVYHDEYEAREICKMLLRDETARKQIVEDCNKYVCNNYSIDIFLGQLSDISGINLD